MILDATLMLILSMSGADIAPTDASVPFTVAVTSTAADEEASAPEVESLDPTHVAHAAEETPAAPTSGVKFPRGVCVDSGAAADPSTPVDFEVCMQPAFREGAPGLNFVGRF